MKTNSRAQTGLLLCGTVVVLAVATLVVTSCSSSSGNANVKRTESLTVEEGVPGGIYVETHEGNATITAIDAQNRMITMVRPDGAETSFQAGPGVVNFPQLRVGDKVKATLTDELVIFVRKKDAPAVDGTATTVLLAPKGAKPGGIVADTVQVTARVEAVDLEHHKAKLRFPDGSVRTVAVRPDVELSPASVGTEVVLRSTKALALSVEKP